MTCDNCMKDQGGTIGGLCLVCTFNKGQAQLAEMRQRAERAESALLNATTIHGSAPTCREADALADETSRSYQADVDRLEAALAAATNEKDKQ